MLRHREGYKNLEAASDKDTTINVKTIILSVAAERQLFALPPSAQDAIDLALTRYATTGFGDVKRLVGSEYLRLRVGRYRILLDEDRTTVLAVYIGKRETTTYRRGRA